MDILRRFFPLPEQSFFLFGPRGTGKSTWLRYVFPDALIIDLLEPAMHRPLDSRPERLREIIAGAPQSEVVVIDECRPGRLEGTREAERVGRKPWTGPRSPPWSPRRCG